MLCNKHIEAVKLETEFSPCTRKSFHKIKNLLWNCFESLTTKTTSLTRVLKYHLDAAVDFRSPLQRGICRSKVMVPLQQTPGRSVMRHKECIGAQTRQ